MIRTMLSRRSKKKRLIGLVVVLSLGIATAAYFRPLPAIEAQVLFPASLPKQSVTLPWPSYGQSALGASGYGLLQINGDQKTVPVASIAKVVTAMAVLKKKPLPIGEEGPAITLGPGDVDLFGSYLARGGSVVKVQSGEKISQYQALQAMLLPSGNNMADSLAIWAFGSLPAYVTYANKMVGDMGLKETHITDASGFSPETTSTASDLVRLGQRAIAQPVLAEITGQSKAVIPVAGEISNVNWALSQDGIIGIKTGSTDEAGGCYLFAAKRELLGQTVTLIGAVLGAETRNQAIADSKTIIRAADSGFEKKDVAFETDTVAVYRSPWGAEAKATVTANLSALGWKESPLKIDSDLESIETGARKGQRVGWLSAVGSERRSTQDVILNNDMSGPSWWWRIFHF